MNDDKISKLVIETVDSQLEVMRFSNESQDAVLEELQNNRRNILSRFLNYKVRIPVNKLIIGVSVASVAVVLLSYQTLRLTPDNIRNSQIQYIEITNDR